MSSEQKSHNGKDQQGTNSSGSHRERRGAS